MIVFTVIVAVIVAVVIVIVIVIVVVMMMSARSIFVLGVGVFTLLDILIRSRLLIGPQRNTTSPSNKKC